MRLREPPPEHRSQSDLCAPKSGTGIGAMQPEACIKQIILKRSGARKSQQRTESSNAKGVALQHGKRKGGSLCPNYCRQRGGLDERPHGPAPARPPRCSSALSTAPVRAAGPTRSRRPQRAHLRARSGAAISMGGRARARHSGGSVKAADDLHTQSAGSNVL